MKFPIPQDWDGVSWCRWAVCWPDSELWRGFLRGLLTLPQRGRTWDERTGSILDIQEVGREITEANLPLVGVFMACNDTDLVLAFEGIASAIRYAADKEFSRPCCGDGGVGGGSNGGYSGTTIQPVGGNTVPIYGVSPPAELPVGETFPEGFDSLEEWDVHRCAVANQIFDGVIFTLLGLRTLNLLNVNVLGVLVLAAIPGFLAFPPAAIGVMIGALIALAIVQHYLTDFRDYMMSTRSEWICIMVTWDNVPVIIGYLADAIDFGLAILPIAGPAGIAVKTILLLLFNGDALNKLFDSTADYSYPDADCSGCLTCEELYFEFDSGLDGFEEIVTLPDCFELALNGSLTLSHDGGVVQALVSGGIPNPNGAFGLVVADYDVRVGSNISVELKTSGCGSLYIDFVLVFDDASCLWGTLSNNDASSDVFHGLSVDLDTSAGKKVVEIYFYLSSSNAGGDNEFLVQFERVGFFCTEE